MVRTTQAGTRAVAVIGSCAIPDDALTGLAGFAVVPDDATWRWSGSYTVIQADEGGVTVWTDVGGAWPIYTLLTADGAYWSSSSRALAGLTDNQVDVDRLAAWLLAPGVPALMNGRSAFARIAHVPAGSRLFLPTVGTPDRRSVWRPQPRSGAHAERLRRELSDAVAIRAHTAGAVTADLSGGYDSTTLALLAADQLSPRRAITGVTVHPAGITVGGDMTYARHVAKHPGIVHRLMPLGSEHTPYSRLDTVPVTDEPAPSTIAYARFAGQLELMRERYGSDCHLTGDGGDGLLCSPPIILADLWGARRYRRLLAETVAWARLRRLAVWPLLRAAVRTARTTRANALLSLAWNWQTGRGDHTATTGVEWCAATVPIPSWATLAARQRAAGVATNIAKRTAEVTNVDHATSVTAEIMVNVGRTARADAQFAELHGIILHNPFTDSRVIDAVLSIPLDERPGPAAYKPILREAMADVFPALLAARQTKGSCTVDYYQGMRANLPTLHTLADGRLAELGLVDPATFRAALTAASTGLPVPFAMVEPVITAEVWLRALGSAPVVPWAAAGDLREVA